MNLCHVIYYGIYSRRGHIHSRFCYIHLSLENTSNYQWGILGLRIREIFDLKNLWILIGKIEHVAPGEEVDGLKIRGPVGKLCVGTSKRLPQQSHLLRISLNLGYGG